MIGFKNPRERSEYAELATKNPKLFDLLHDLVSYVQDTFKKDVVLTSVYRTAEEQAALYAKAVHKVLKSDHMSWEAVDLRSSIYTKGEIDSIVAYLNTKYKNRDGRRVALYHSVPGNVPHFHISLKST